MAGSSERLRLVRLALLSAAVWAMGCTEQQSPTAPSLAQGGGGGGGPTVRAADPDTGLQNTTIDVRVLGSGFDNGSRAVWAIDGDTALATTKITTNSTRFVKSGELVANITIAADAPLALFDIMVVTTGGKKGIGIEKFEVNSGQYSALFADGAGDKLRSDNGTAYEHGGPDYNPNCVLSLHDGPYQLRTIAPTDFCKAVIRPGWRYFKIDFGTPVVDLDQDGVAEAIEDAPGRMLAGAFATGVTATSARILIFVVNPDGSTTWDTRYTLYFQAVAVTDGGGGVRILEASGSNAAADLYLGYADPARSPPKRNPPMATVQLPFKLTLTPML
jgi:hypothetical protein